MFVFFCCRLIPSLLSESLVGRPSREPRENPPTLELRLLLSPDIPFPPVPSLLLRSPLPVEVGTWLFLLLIELPIREDLLELIRELELPACGFVLRVLGVFVLMELPIREDLLELIRELELPACGFILRVLGVFVLMELPIREDLLELIRELKLPACGFELRVLGVLVLMELPIRKDLLELIRELKLPDGLRVLEVTPDRIVTGRLTGVRLD